MAVDSVISGWLQSYGIPQYTQSFIDNGYDDLEICKQIGDMDLNAIGVEHAAHRDIILRGVHALRKESGSGPRTPVYFTLEDTSQLGTGTVQKDGMLKVKSHDTDDTVFADVCAFASPTSSNNKPQSTDGYNQYSTRCTNDEYGAAALHHKHTNHSDYGASMSHHKHPNQPNAGFIENTTKFVGNMYDKSDSAYAVNDVPYLGKNTIYDAKNSMHFRNRAEIYDDKSNVVYLASDGSDGSYNIHNASYVVTDGGNSDQNNSAYFSGNTSAASYPSNMFASGNTRIYSPVNNGVYSGINDHILTYDESKSLSAYPKVQLKLLLRDKLIADGINLAASPYTNKSGDPGASSLENLSLQYAMDLNTHVQDVSDRLEELRWTWNIAQSSQGTPVKHTDRLCDDEIEPCLAPDSQPSPSHVVPDYIRLDGKGMCCLLPRTVKLGSPDTPTKRRNGLLGWLNKSSKRSLKKYVYRIKKGELNAKDITMSEEDRLALMLMVKEGRISQDVALEVVKRFELAKKRPGSTPSKAVNGSPKSLGGASSASSSPWNSPVITNKHASDPCTSDTAIYNPEAHCEACIRGEPHNYADTGCLYGRCRSSRSANRQPSTSNMSDYYDPIGQYGTPPHRFVRTLSTASPLRYPTTKGPPPYPHSSSSDNSVECPTNTLLADTPRHADMVYTSTNSSSLSVGSDLPPFLILTGDGKNARASLGSEDQKSDASGESIYSQAYKPRPSKKPPPRTVDDLLTRIGLLHLGGIFMQNGFETLDKFAEVNENHLNKLHINDPEQRAKILTAAELFGDFHSVGASNTSSEALPTPFHSQSLSPSQPHDYRKDSGCYDATENHQHPRSSIPQMENPQNSRSSISQTNGAIQPRESDITLSNNATQHNNGNSQKSIVTVHGVEISEEDQEVSGINSQNIPDGNILENQRNLPKSDELESERNFTDKTQKLPQNSQHFSNSPVNKTNNAVLNNNVDSLRNIQDIFYNLPSNSPKTCYSLQTNGYDAYNISRQNAVSNSPDKKTHSSLKPQHKRTTRYAPKYNRYCDNLEKPDSFHTKGTGSLDSSDCTSSDLSDSSPFKKPNPPVLVEKFQQNTLPSTSESYICEVNQLATYREYPRENESEICKDTGFNHSSVAISNDVKHDPCITNGLYKYSDKGRFINDRTLNGCAVIGKLNQNQNDESKMNKSMFSPSRSNIRTSFVNNSPNRTNITQSICLSNGSSIDEHSPKRNNLMTASYNANLRPKNPIFDVSQYVISKANDKNHDAKLEENSTHVISRPIDDKFVGGKSQPNSSGKLPDEKNSDVISSDGNGKLLNSGTRLKGAGGLLSNTNIVSSDINGKIPNSDRLSDPNPMLPNSNGKTPASDRLSNPNPLLTDAVGKLPDFHTMEISHNLDSHTSVDDLLSTVNLTQYSGNFHDNGFIHATQLLLLKETDLRELGVTDHKHLGRLQHSLDVLRLKHISPTHTIDKV